MSNRSQVRLLQHVARIWSIFSLAFITIFFVGEGIMSEATALQSNEWIGLAFFPTGLAIGLILAWWREGWGGLIGLGSFLAFYLSHYLTTSTFTRGPYFALVAAPTLLFLLYAYLKNRRQGQQFKMS